MCATCGCDHESNVLIQRVEKASPLELAGLSFQPVPVNIRPLAERKQIDLEQDILLKNNLKAEHNRSHFLANGILALNLVSSPGSGKTTLLERTLTDLKGELDFYVIEGDQQTTNDADRIDATGVPVVQINTGKGCHLDSQMIESAVEKLKPTSDSVVFIENIGNLVCPAMFDLGEQGRVVIISVTEGDDKPLKYPDMFESSDICIINKIDLLPYVNFNCGKAKEYARRINRKLQFFELSATTGEGIDQWYRWLKSKTSANISVV
jgi:hydrogenase nickel incorporation protein HypB